MKRRKAIAALALMGSLMGWACSAAQVFAQTPAPYPERPIQIVVPYPPGGGVDVLVRRLAPRLTAAWGQPIVVDNRPGAGGSLGTAVVAKARPDGYTLLVATNSPFTTNPLLAPIDYDPLRDFEPVIVAAEIPMVLVVNPKLPAKSVGELIALARQKPRELNAGSSGNGTTAHLALAQFNRIGGAEVVHVPYKGGAPSLTATVTGEVQMNFSDLVPAMPFIRDGRLRALATTGLRRAGIAPDLSTMSESGMAGFNLTAWLAMVAPRGTPKDIVQKLNGEIARALKDPAFARQLVDMGIDPLGGTPEEFAELLKKEIPRWKEIVSQAGLKTD
jgi:tripartite-type tricarboxylate transporter receptor subunit TctC